MNKPILITLLVLPFLMFSQNCDCETNFNWVKTTFEKNDAGFAYALESKGEQVYQAHNESFAQRIKSIEEPNECVATIKEWLAFFRSGHVHVGLAGPASTGNSETPSDKDIIARYKGSERVNVNLEEFTKYLEAKKEVDYEGIWVSEPYKIGIKKIKDEYVGFIIEADGVYWTKGQVKFKIKADNSSVYYLRDHSEQTFPSVELLSDNYMKTGFITLKRVVPKYDSNPEIERYFNAINANKPYFEIIDDNTTYLRIPTFNGAEKSVIDSVIAANKDLVLKTHNFIIDIRNNGGGSDRSYYELLPILYTNPIRTVGVEFLSTPLNNQRMLDFISDPSYGFDEEGKKWAQESFDILDKRKGEFVNLDSTVVDITKYDTIHQLPKNVGIIINEGNGSTAEQFLLAAKQSKKVKLFGTTTVGVLDISNMYLITSPCGDLEFGYSLSRSMRIPDMTIDNKGIQPDLYIDKSIPAYKWIDFVTETLNN